MIKWSAAAALLTALFLFVHDDTDARQPPRVRLFAVTSETTEIRAADRLVTRMSRAGELARQDNFPDTWLPGRQHERFQQTVKGVPVWGSTITRQHAGGVPVSVFGAIYEGLDLEVDAVLTPDEARAIVANASAQQLGDVPTPLYVLVTRSVPRLVYAVRAADSRLGLTLYFIDAMSGAIVETRDVRKRQHVGTGAGVFGPAKKISSMLLGGRFVAADALRPPVLETFDFGGDWRAVIQHLNGVRPLFPSDLASDTDNQWTDPAAVDAHVYSGWTYDYLFKRFDRLGLDNENLPILNIVHPISRSDLRSAIDFGLVDLLINALYVGDGTMIYGDGLPPAVTLGGQSIDYMSGALDIVAHELTHGVTDFTSQLEYVGESGALNESFSDILGTSIEFFFQPAGTGRGQADYLIGEDVVRPGGFRSMADPAAFGDPDHYSRRYVGTDDNGGVHINSSIPNQAFYLAAEGGRNRTSGLTVAGVGGANREQIERVFYRAFTTMLPAQAQFSTARAATIQAARDLYGSGSAVERAVTEAWTAVGVF